MEIYQNWMGSMTLPTGAPHSCVRKWLGQRPCGVSYGIMRYMRCIAMPSKHELWGPKANQTGWKVDSTARYLVHLRTADNNQSCSFCVLFSAVLNQGNPSIFEEKAARAIVRMAWSEAKRRHTVSFLMEPRAAGRLAWKVYSFCRSLDPTCS